MRILWKVVLVGLLIFTGSTTMYAESATVFRVTSTADAIDSDVNDNLCRTSAGDCTLRAAVMQANASAGMDTIELPPGTYTLTRQGILEDLAQFGDLDITDDVEIVGDDAAEIVDVDGDVACVSDITDDALDAAGDAACAVADVADDAAEIVSVNSLSVVIDGGGLDRVLHVIDISTQVTLQNMTIQNGNTVVEEESGGGIYNAGQLTLQNVTVQDNETESHGGGIYSTGMLDIMQSMIVSNRVVPTNNTNQRYGGGVYSVGTITLTDTTLQENAANYGGGLFCVGTTTINNSTFSANTAEREGGGWHCAGEIVMTDSALHNNTASKGAGFYNKGRSDGSAHIVNADIHGNTAVIHGGGGYSEAPMAIESSTIYSNTITDSALFNRLRGGAGIVNNGSMWMSNVSIRENISQSNGGGVYNNGWLDIHRGDIEYNDAEGMGGGIYLAELSRRPNELNLFDTAVQRNRSIESGGGLYISTGSTVLIERSSISINSAGNMGWEFIGPGENPYPVPDENPDPDPEEEDSYPVTGSTTRIRATATPDPYPPPPTREPIVASDDGLGGGIFNDGIMTISNSTIGANRATQFGGGIMHGQSSDARLSLNNVTVASNWGISGRDSLAVVLGEATLQNTILDACRADRPIISNGHNLIRDIGDCSFTGDTANDIIDSPHLYAYTENGMLIYELQTGTGELGLNSHRSRAIGAGNPAECPSQDQRGYPRFLPCDIGAYEVDEFESLNTIYLSTVFNVTDGTDDVPSPIPATGFAVSVGTTSEKEAVLFASIISPAVLLSGMILWPFRRRFATPHDAE